MDTEDEMSVSRTQNSPTDRMASPSEGEGQLEEGSELHYIDLDELGNSRRPHVCDGCEVQTAAAYHKCTHCADYDLCDICIKNAATKHPNHVFERIDLRSLMLQQQRLSKIPPELSAKRYIQVSKDCCPTCLDHRPAKFDPTDSSSTRPERNKKQTSWMSTYPIYVSDFRASSARGCDLCSIIYRGVLAARPDLISEDGRVQVVIHRDHFRIADLSGIDDRLQDMWTLYFRAGPDSKPPWNTLGQARSFSNHFNSETCFQKIREWAKLCEESHAHPDCKRDASAVLPQRVIEISADGKDSGSVTLALRETNGQMGRYIALSHCWGTIPIVTTNLANMEHMKQEINVESLPQTFKDAVHCARKLGIKYIWIDSLCIIQDSTSDWEIQSSKMASVYANAYFVLVAASADSDTKGFLHERPKRYQGIPLEAFEGSGVYEVMVNHTMPHPSGLWKVRAKSVMLDSQVDRRAWVMQETVLARRVVYIHTSEMLWECNSKVMCECGMASSTGSGRARVRHFDQSDQQSRRFTAYRSTKQSDLSGDYPTFRAMTIGFSFFRQSYEIDLSTRPFARLHSAECTYAEWRLIIVPLYTAKRLTYVKDKLPALSGLASRVKDYLEDEYIAGLWRGDMPMSLIWYVRSNSKRSALSTYLSPSFSWVSINRPVIYPALHRYNEFGGPMYGSLTVEVLEAKTSVKGSNPFGLVDDGHLRLEGLTHPLYLILDGIESEIEVGSSHHDLAWYPDTALVAVDLAPTDGDKESVVSVNRSSKPADPSQQRCQVTVTCVLVINRPHVEGTEICQSYDEYALLVLGRLKSRPEVYQRLGLAFVGLEPALAEKWVAGAEMRELLVV